MGIWYKSLESFHKSIQSIFQPFLRIPPLPKESVAISLHSLQLSARKFLERIRSKWPRRPNIVFFYRRGQGGARGRGPFWPFWGSEGLFGPSGAFRPFWAPGPHLGPISRGGGLSRPKPHYNDYNGVMSLVSLSEGGSYTFRLYFKQVNRITQRIITNRMS